jgi:hypothetical protein
MAPVATRNFSTASTAESRSVVSLDKNPLLRTFRGDREGTLRILGYPSFKDAKDEEGLLKKRKWIKEHMAVCLRFWGKLGFGDGPR